MSESGLYRVDVTERQKDDKTNGWTIRREWEISEPAPYTGEWERGIYHRSPSLDGKPLCTTVIGSNPTEAKAVALDYVTQAKAVTEGAMKAAIDSMVRHHLEEFTGGPASDRASASRGLIQIIDPREVLP